VAPAAIDDTYRAASQDSRVQFLILHFTSEDFPTQWPDEKVVAARTPRYEGALPDAAWFQARLAQHGYGVPRTGALDLETRNVIAAFQMKYRPARFDGQPDAQTAAILDALTFPRAESMPALDDALAVIANDPQHRVASLSALAVRDGHIVYEHQFGPRFIGKPGVDAKPANARTLYRIASISKLVTAIGVMRLVEEGKLGLDEDVSAYLGWRLRNPHFPDAKITLRMLLTHTSSLRDGAFYFWPANVAIKDVLLPGGAQYGEGLMWARDHPPGNYFTYCNLNSGVIATIMERVTGERFDRLIKRLVLDPLGMRGGFNPADFTGEELADIATLYCKCTERDNVEKWDPAGPWNPQVDDYSTRRPEVRADEKYVPGTNGTVFGPQGNLRVSAADLAKVLLMMMNGGEYEGRRLLAPTTVDEMLTIQWRYDPASPNGDHSDGKRQRLYNAWGLGVQVFLGETGPFAGDKVVMTHDFDAAGHLGDAYGLTSALLFDRERRTGMIFLIGGTAFDPATYPGEHSALYRHEELILDAIYRDAIETPP